MLNSNEVAININTTFSNYKYYFSRIICIDSVISNWIELIQKNSSFFKIKLKWFKFFVKTISSRQFLNNYKIYAMGLNKFELKSLKIYIFKIQLINNSFINIAHLFFEGIPKTIIFQKNKVLCTNHWIIKPVFRYNFLLNKSCHFLVTKMTKLYQNLDSLWVFKLKKIAFCNILLNKFKEQVLNILCGCNLSKLLFFKKVFCSSLFNLTLIVNNKVLLKNNVFNIIIYDYYLIFLDYFVIDLLNLNYNMFYVRFFVRYCVGFKSKLYLTIVHNLLNNFIKFNLFLNVVKDKKLNLKNKNNSLTFLNYLFLTSDFNSSATRFIWKVNYIKLNILNNKIKIVM